MKLSAELMSKCMVKPSPAWLKAIPASVDALCIFHGWQDNRLSSLQWAGIEKQLHGFFDQCIREVAGAGRNISSSAWVKTSIPVLAVIAGGTLRPKMDQGSRYPDKVHYRKGVFNPFLRIADDTSTGHFGTGPLVVGMATQVSISMPHWRPNRQSLLLRPGQNRRQNR